MGGVANKISTGVKNSFSNPVNAIATVATGGLYGVVKENQKASADAATAGATALIASGGNPIAAALAATAGAIKGGTDKRGIADSALQSAVIGAGVGVTSAGISAYQSAQAASTATKISAAEQAANNALSLTPTGASTTPYTLATAGTGVGQGATASTSFLGSVGSGIAKGASTVWGGVTSTANTVAKTVLPVALYQKLFGPTPPGGGSDSAPGVVPYDQAITGGLNPQTGTVVIPAGSSAGTTDTAAASPVLAAIGPLIGFLVIPGGLAVGVWWWWKHRHKHKS